MKEYIPVLGFILVFAGIVIIVASSILGSGKSKVAFGGFIGPFPFGFANSPTMLWVLVGLITVVVLLNFALRYTR